MTTKILYQLWVEFPDNSWICLGFFFDARAAMDEYKIQASKREIEGYAPAFLDSKILEVRDVWV